MTQKLSWFPLGESLSSVEYFWLKTYGESATFWNLKNIVSYACANNYPLVSTPTMPISFMNVVYLHRDVMLLDKYQNKAKAAKYSVKL